MDMVMPHSLEAEQVVLGAIINDKDKIYEVEDILTVEDFYYEKHRGIYSGILNLRSRDKDIDLVTLADQLKAMGSLEKSGGITYLSELSSAATYLNNARTYSEILVEKSSRRRVIKSCMKAIDDSHGDASMDEVVEVLDGNIHKAYSGKTLEDMEPIMTSMQEAITSIEERYLGKKEIQGITTGYKDLDILISGLQRGDFVVIAGRPSMGKTAFALNIAQYASKEGSVGLFSLEMPKNQIMQRLLSARCLIPLKNIRSGELSEYDIEKLMLGAGDLSKRKFFIDDKSTTMSAIKSKARTLKRKSGLEVIIIDYLQLIEATDKSHSREQEIAKISRELKALAKSLDITVIALSQLSRAPEQRADSRPMLSDLRESGSIEQDADIVMFPYREGYYDKEIKEGNAVEIILGKNRNGETKTIRLMWIGEYQRFTPVGFDN
ncbi:MAG: replicative DNA helicase [Clostridium sp.]|uniref:replicative DNA helicase n=1 Tax=Clostridium sp. TaxID=1506 RepID=UPI00303682C4